MSSFFPHGMHSTTCAERWRAFIFFLYVYFDMCLHLHCQRSLHGELPHNYFLLMHVRKYIQELVEPKEATPDTRLSRMWNTEMPRAEMVCSGHITNSKKKNKTSLGTWRHWATLLYENSTLTDLGRQQYEKQAKAIRHKITLLTRNPWFITYTLVKSLTEDEGEKHKENFTV